MAKAGISGLAVGVATAGGILVYAGFRGVNPLEALRDIGSGKPPAPASPGLDLVGTATSATLSGAAAGQISVVAQKYAGDKYSQAKRTQKGWSDCSSFCDKILTDIGVPPPVKWASTANFRLSATWKVIPLASAKPGDVAVNSHHMVMITGDGGSSAIGQQNTRVNVRTGTVSQLIDSFKVYRYTPGTKGNSRYPGE